MSGSVSLEDDFEAFSEDKRAFFNEIMTQGDVDKRLLSNKLGYVFLAKHRLLIEQEFDNIFTVLKQRDQQEDVTLFWRYCYYCCKLLNSYYTAYDKKDKADFYLATSKKLLAPCEGRPFPKDKILSLKERIKEDLGRLIVTPKQVSKIRDWVGFSNIHRIHFNFCRFAIKQTVTVARELQWIQKLDELFGKKTDVEGIMATLNKPAPIFNVLSVGIFAARFIINAGMLIKHTFMPTAEERLLSRTQRFYNEIYARHCVMLNDVVWGTVNLLTNYNAVFMISAPLASWLTAGFLFFDVALLIHRRRLAEQEFFKKEAQYLSEIRVLEQRKKGLDTPIEVRDALDRECDMIRWQLIQLELDRKKSIAVFQFNIAAAALIMGGFAAALLLAATPASVLVSYLVCTVAIAMYLSADVYGAYKEKSLLLASHRKHGVISSPEQLDAVGTARNNLILAMVKNIMMPLLIVTTFAICWQAALILTALYIGYECTKGYFPSLPLFTKPDKKTPEKLPMGDVENPMVLAS